MFKTRTISISIDRSWQEVYEAIWRPERFPDWASGLSEANLRWEKGRWRATGPDGPVIIDFTDHNAFGVMDHTVHLESNRDVFIPLRIVANGSGAEVMLTLFRQDGMSDEVFARDAAWVERDLAALRRLFMP